MSKFRQHSGDTKEIVDISAYVDKQGQIIDAIEGESTRVVVAKKGDMYLTIESNNYSVIDTEAIYALSEILNDTDFGRVLKLSVTTTTPFNILTNTNNHFHTNNTLQHYLAISSRGKFFDFIKRLMRVGIIYQMKGLIHGEVRVIYMLNPLLSRKRKSFDPKIKEIFNDFNDLIITKEELYKLPARKETADDKCLDE